MRFSNTDCSKGHMQPVTVFVEDLANELGVSKQPVMEALRRLSAESFVVITPQVACRVIEYDFDEIFAFFQMMAAVEARRLRWQPTGAPRKSCADWS
jgi:DNA-binding GntR family transcriptional regulator